MKVHMQQNKKTVYLNPAPLAAGTYFQVDLVRSALQAIFQAIVDLVERDYDINLNMVCLRLKVMSRNVNIKFSREIVEKGKWKPKENPLTRTQSLPRLSDTWRKPAFSKSMMNFMERPNSREYSAKTRSTANLRVMSLDLNSFKAMDRVVS